jgi:hypothetical protein
MSEFCIDFKTILIVGSEIIVKYFTSFFKKYSTSSINIVPFYSAEKFISRQSGFIGKIDLAVIDIYQSDWFELSIKLQREEKHNVHNILLTRNGDHKKYFDEITKYELYCFNNKEIFNNLVEECLDISEHTTATIKQFINLKFKRDYYKELSIEYYDYVDENRELKNKINSIVNKEKELFAKIEVDKKFHADNIHKLHKDICKSVVLMETIDIGFRNNNLCIEELMSLIKDLSAQIRQLDEKINFINDLYDSNTENKTILKECFQKVRIDLRQKLELKSLEFNLDSLNTYSLKISPSIVQEILSYYLMAYIKHIQNSPPKIQNNEFIKIKSNKPFISGKVYLQMDFFSESLITFGKNAFINNVIDLLKIEINSQYINETKSQKVSIIFPPEMVVSSQN